MIKIFGKDYITVAERVKLAEKDIKSINTEVLFQSPVVIKATVGLKDGREATGISAANPTKTIEKTSPYEVAETSALGRALGFLGYGIVEGIATADEMLKANKEPVSTVQSAQQKVAEVQKPITSNKCTCNAPASKPHGKQCPLYINPTRGLAGKNFPND